MLIRALVAIGVRGRIVQRLEMAQIKALAKVKGLGACGMRFLVAAQTTPIKQLVRGRTTPMAGLALGMNQLVHLWGRINQLARHNRDALGMRAHVQIFQIPIKALARGMLAALGILARQIVMILMQPTRALAPQILVVRGIVIIHFVMVFAQENMTHHALVACALVTIMMAIARVCLELGVLERLLVAI
jgi:hypothetical protein